MTRLANRTSRRHDESRALNAFDRAAAFHTMSAQLPQLNAPAFHALALALAFSFLA
jgi:hypothetical protein